MQKSYWSLTVSDDGKEAHIYIFGDITSWEWLESDVSSYSLASYVANLEAEHIICHINSYGGEVAEGLAIYNTLKNCKAKVTTVCDGFACSAAAAVFMAGSERVMNAASLLMIHNAWMFAAGDADGLRKAADDLEKISDVSLNVFREAGVTLTDEEIKAMCDEETWITPEEAFAWGFATAIRKNEAGGKAAASAKAKAYSLLLGGIKAAASQKPAKPETERKPATEAAEEKPMADGRAALFLQAAREYIEKDRKIRRTTGDD